MSEDSTFNGITANELHNQVIAIIGGEEYIGHEEQIAPRDATTGQMTFAAEYVNATGHALDVLTPAGRHFTIPPSGWVVSATPREKVAGERYGVTFVQTVFEPSAEGQAMLDAIRKFHGYAIVIGSMIAAQAYPGQIVAGVSAPGLERVPPAEKRIRADKFTTFGPVV